MSDDCGSAAISPQHIEGFSTFLSPMSPFYPFPPNHSTYVDISMTLLSASASAIWTIVFRWFNAAGDSIALTDMPSITGTSGSSFLHYGPIDSPAAQFGFSLSADISMLGLAWTADLGAGTVVFLGCDEPTGGGGGVGKPNRMVTILG